MKDYEEKAEKFVEANIGSLLESDSTYAARAEGTLRSAEDLKRQARRELKQRYWNPDVLERTTRGLNALLDELPRHMSEEEYVVTAKEFEGMEKAFKRAVEKGEEVSVQQLLGLSDMTLLRSFDVGMDLLGSERWEDAFNVFAFLALLRGDLSNHWIGIGRALQGSEEIEAAVETYRLASAVDEQNPASYFYACQCHLQLGNKEEAEHDLHNLEAVGKESVWVEAAKLLRQELR